MGAVCGGATLHPSRRLLRGLLRIRSVAGYTAALSSALARSYAARTISFP